MADESMVFNGIDARSGGYLIAPMSPELMGKVARGTTLEPGELEELQQRKRQGSEAHFGVKAGIDPKDLSQAGWGAIFPFAKPGTEEGKRQAAIREALAPLLEHRRAQAAAKHEHYYKDYVGQHAYRPGENKNKFLARNGAGPGPADPDLIPYYLLIVGGPDEIPYRVQYQIDVQYAVGRIHFDTIAEYAAYAESVVHAETKGLALARRAAFFGVANADDRATQASSKYLVDPLAGYLAKDQQANGWKIDRYLGEQATKATLHSLLGGGETPALLFSASHGMGFPNGDPQQLDHQGALLCQDWPGPDKWRKEIGQDFYFAGDDLGADARVAGLIAFFFACYGGGTPQYDEFSSRAHGKRESIAPRDFVAGLPRRMLAHPNGGALAAVSHIDRAWGCSFLWAGTKDKDGSSKQLAVFEDSLKKLTEGHPIGSAMEAFNERYAELSSDLTEKIDELEFMDEEPAGTDVELAQMWTANNDARGYAIVGDPAVRLAVAPATGGGEVGREAIQLSAETQAGLTAGPASAVSPPAPVDPVKDPAVSSDASAGAPQTDSIEFGLFGRSEGSGEPGALQRFADQVLSKLSHAIEDTTTLEIKTYVTDDMERVTKTRAGSLGEVGQLRAFTRIALDGDMEVCVPLKGGEVDGALFEVHKQMVQEARAQRQHMIEASLGAIKGLLQILK